MKKQVNPAVTAVVIIVAVLGIGFAMFMKAGGFGPTVMLSRDNPPPKEAAEGMRKGMENMMKQRAAEKQRSQQGN